AGMGHGPGVPRLVGGRIAGNAAAHWIAFLTRAGVPCGPVMGLSQVFSDPQVLAQDMVLDVPHPGHGTVRMTGFPVKLSATPCRIRRPAPELGGQTAEILREAGFTDAEIGTLREDAAVA